MPYFESTSKERLRTCRPELQVVFNSVIKHFDCSIICGYRNKEEQDKAFYSRPQLSKAKWLESPHNYNKSFAVDVVPWPSQYEDIDCMIYFAGFVKGVALSHGIKLRWGGDWDGDHIVGRRDPDESLFDSPHFEMKNWRSLVNA